MSGKRIGRELNAAATSGGGHESACFNPETDQDDTQHSTVISRQRTHVHHAAMGPSGFLQQVANLMVLSVSAVIHVASHGQELL